MRRGTQTDRWFFSSLPCSSLLTIKVARMIFLPAPDTPAGVTGRFACRFALASWPLAAVGGALLVTSDKLAIRGDNIGLAFGAGAACLLVAAVTCVAGLGVAGVATTRQLPYMPDPGRGWIYLGMGLNALPILLTGVAVVLSVMYADKAPVPNR